MGTHPDRDELLIWIATLRGRAERGDLARLGTYATEGGTLDITLAARVMLADLDHFGDLSPDRRRDLDIRIRRGLLLDDFRRLRAQIG